MGRQSQLDGLRGIAAVIVLLHHCSLVMPGLRDRLTDLVWPRPLLAGPQAVVLFFVLSGFVLFEAWQRKRSYGYWAWIKGRTARLMIPTIVCVTISFLLAKAIRPHAIVGLSDWFNTFSWAGSVTMDTWLRNVIPLDGRNNHQLDNATWSLVHEFRVSVVFPLIAIMVARSWRVTLAATVLLSLFVPEKPSSSFDLLWTCHYLYLFAAGAALSYNRLEVAAAFQQQGTMARVLFLLLSLSAMLSGASLAAAPELLVCAGAIMLVAACAFDESVAAFLRQPLLLWLGRMSFSLYLIHLPVLLTIVHLLYGKLPTPVLGTMVISLSILSATILEFLVEQPSQRLGRRFGRPANSPASPFSAPSAALNY